MTREEIKERYHSDSVPNVMNVMFDEIVDFVCDNYDNFESITCENCEHCDIRTSGNYMSSVCINKLSDCILSQVSLGFGCNKFERKGK